MMDEEIEKKVNKTLPVTPKQQILNKIPKRGFEKDDVIKEGKMDEQKFFLFSSFFEMMILDEEDEIG